MKSLLVTGATRGIGLAVVKRQLQEGFLVVGTARNRSSEFDSLEAEYPQKCFFYPFDLMSPNKIPEFANMLTAEYGPFFGLVNNAGIGTSGVLATLHASDIAKTLAINLEAPITLTKYICRTMLAQAEGRIVNISSIIARTGFNGLSVYAASKAGLEGFSRSLARELGRANITVNCVAPGYIETDMTDDIQGVKLNAIRRRSPLGLASVDDVAGAVAYLISPDGQKITGATLTIDGGSTA